MSERTRTATESSTTTAGSADYYFAMIPEWVLYADISANAVRVYGVLRRHADRDDATCHPGRKRIASLIHASTSSVDRAVAELVEIGAVEVFERRDPDNPKQLLSNRYRVRSTPRTGDDTPRTGDHTPPAGDDTPLPPVTTPPPAGDEVTRAIELEPLEPETHSPSSTSSTDGFDEFWSQYPRKVGKGQARKRWEKMKAGARASALAAVSAHAESWAQAGTESRYIPHPATWLSAERWDDELTAVAPAKRGNSLSDLDAALASVKAELTGSHERNAVLELPTETGDMP